MWTTSICGAIPNSPSQFFYQEILQVLGTDYIREDYFPVLLANYSNTAVTQYLRATVSLALFLKLF